MVPWGGCNEFGFDAHPWGAVIAGGGRLVCEPAVSIGLQGASERDGQCGWRQRTLLHPGPAEPEWEGRRRRPSFEQRPVRGRSRRPSRCRVPLRLDSAGEGAGEGGEREREKSLLGQAWVSHPGRSTSPGQQLGAGQRPGLPPRPARRALPGPPARGVSLARPPAFSQRIPALTSTVLPGSFL